MKALSTTNIQRLIGLLLCWLFFMTGCEGDIPNHILETDRFENTIASAESIDKVTPLEDFTANIMPDAEIFDTIVHDIDGNGEDDYIILFSVDDDSHSISAGLAVCLSNSLYSAINLDSNNYLTFASGATLTYNKDIPTISVSLKDAESGIDYIFAVEYTIDSVNREINYSIRSEVKK